MSSLSDSQPSSKSPNIRIVVFDDPMMSIPVDLLPNDPGFLKQLLELFRERIQVTENIVGIYEKMIFTKEPRVGGMA